MIKIAIILFALTFSVSLPVCADEYEDAYENTQTEFQAVKDTVDQTKEKIDDLKDKLEKAEKFIAENPGLVPDGKKVLAKIQEARESLGSHAETLKTFSEHAGKVTDAFATANELISVHQAAKEHSGGKLAENLHYIGTAMDKFGDKVPILGPAVQAYGQMTTGLLTATDQVAKKINDTRNQGMIGAGTYGGTDNEKYQKLKEQFGSDYADGDTFEPSQSNFIYRPVGNPGGDALVWDKASGEWYRVPGNVPVEQIYRDNLLAGKRPDPWQLKVYSDHYEKTQDRQEQAEQIYDVLKKNWALPYDMTDKEEFIANYTYDKDANQKIRDRLGDLKDKFEAEGNKGGLKVIDKLVDKTGVELPGKEKDGKTDGKDEKTEGEKETGEKDKDKPAEKGGQDKGTDDASGEKDGQTEKDGEEKQDDLTDDDEKTGDTEEGSEGEKSDSKGKKGIPEKEKVTTQDVTGEGDAGNEDQAEGEGEEETTDGEDGTEQEVPPTIAEPPVTPVVPETNLNYRPCGFLLGSSRSAEAPSSSGDPFSASDGISSGSGASAPDTRGMSMPAPAAPQQSSGHACSHDG